MIYLGSSLNFSANGWWGKEKNLSAEKSVRPKVLGAKPKQAGKKEGGWGEGIFARLLPFPFRLSKGKAEGGFGGNSAFPLLNQNEASPATLLFKARHHRKILFSLGEKEIRRAQNEKSKEYFSVVWRVERAVAGLASLVGVLRKMGSDFFKQTPRVEKSPRKRAFLLCGRKQSICILCIRTRKAFYYSEPVEELKRCTDHVMVEIPVRSTIRNLFAKMGLKYHT